MPHGHSAPWLMGCGFTPVSETGWPLTHRARTAHPAGHSVQWVKRARISPRAGRGIPGQFSLHSAVSVISRHGAGVSSAPAAPPPTNLRRLRRGVVVFGGAPFYKLGEEEPASPPPPLLPFVVRAPPPRRGRRHCPRRSAAHEFEKVTAGRRHLWQAHL